MAVSSVQKLANGGEYRRECNNGILSESYIPKGLQNNDSSIILVNGIGVVPPREGVVENALETGNLKALRESSYSGTYLFDQAIKSGKRVHAVYQPAIKRGDGLYNDQTTLELINALLDLAEEKPFTAVGHSLGNLAVMLLANQSFRQEARPKGILPVVLTSPYTNMKDALAPAEGRKRARDYIPWMPLFWAGQKLPFKLNIYPLAPQWYHDPMHSAMEEVPGWGANPTVDLRSAKYTLGNNGEAIAKGLEPNGQPLVFATVKDRIFSKENQLAVGQALGAKIHTLPTGHRWFTDRDSCLTVAEKVAGFHLQNLADFKTITHHQKNLEERLLYEKALNDLAENQGVR